MNTLVKEARYYKTLNQDKVQCFLCPHNCQIESDGYGVCRVRKNSNGKLFSLNYGKVASYGKDPIEKKPLYHFYPGEKIFSVGSYGCNFTCDFCQNYGISQETPSVIETPAGNLADIALNEKNNIGVAYTYNEPTIWFEFMHDITKEVRKSNKKNVLITNGYINIEPLKEILPYIDAMNIDLKSMNPEYYKKYCGGELAPVLESIKIASKNTHVELSTLLIEGLNTSEEEIEEIAKWIASIDDSIPLHLNRYFPNYKMKLPATKVELVKSLAKIAKKHLKYVYVGNIKEGDHNTYCPKCSELLIDRSGLVKKLLNNDGTCHKCGFKTNIILRDSES